jgi:hypothetical protein
LHDHPTPNFALLTREEAADVKRREGVQRDPADKDEAWSCNCCGIYRDKLAKREPVVEHLKTM